jgi:hypothetical protein
VWIHFDGVGNKICFQLKKTEGNEGDKVAPLVSLVIGQSVRNKNMSQGSPALKLCPERGIMKMWVSSLKKNLKKEPRLKQI